VKGMASLYAVRIKCFLLRLSAHHSHGAPWGVRRGREVGQKEGKVGQEWGVHKGTGGREVGLLCTRLGVEWRGG